MPLLSVYKHIVVQSIIKTKKVSAQSAFNQTTETFPQDRKRNKQYDYDFIINATQMFVNNKKRKNLENSRLFPGVIIMKLEETLPWADFIVTHSTDNVKQKSLGKTPKPFCFKSLEKSVDFDGHL